MKNFKFLLIILLLFTLFSCKKETIETIPTGLYEVKLQNIKHKEHDINEQVHVVELVSVNDNYIVFAPVDSPGENVQLSRGRKDDVSGELPISLFGNPPNPFRAVKADGKILITEDIVYIAGRFTGYMEQHGSPGGAPVSYYPVEGEFYLLRKE